MPEIRIGTSGWSYDDWVGIVYPPKSPARERLDWYVKRFDTVEVNATYYHWPKESVFEGWRERLPEDFLFTVKAPRGLTHYSRLAEPGEWIERIRGGMKALGTRRGVLLVQLPPSMECDLGVLDQFLAAMPDWQRVTFEFRHPSWNDDSVFDVLQKHNTAYCVMSGAQLPCILRATADFVYVRLHGPDSKRLYVGSYTDDDLRWWAERIREWTAQGRDVYAYFNNDYHGNAVRNAESLREFCGQKA